MNRVRVLHIVMPVTCFVGLLMAYWLACWARAREEEQIQDTKGIIRSDKSKKEKQYNGQWNKANRKNNDQQNTTQKAKYPAIIM